MNFLKAISLVCLGLVSLGASAQAGFIENKGQYDIPIAFQAELSTHTIYLDKDGFSLLLHDEKQWSEMVHDFHENKLARHYSTEALEPLSLDYQHIKYEFVGANLQNSRGVDTSMGYYNFYLGTDSTQWVSGAHKYTKVLYTDIYPAIDLEYELIDERFKYNFILRPGADINDIQLSIVGADGVDITSDRVTISTQFGSYSEIMPISYEIEKGEKKSVAMRYVALNGNRIGFETPLFRNKVTTVIDPEIIFSTYSGSTVDNFGFTATYDAAGNLYAGGIATSPTTFANGRYPATPGAFSVTFNGGVGLQPATLPCDISISKYTPDGSSLLYATYLGGWSDEYPHSMIVDKDDNLIIFGTTYSSNYPTTATGAFRQNSGNADIIVTKLNSSGTSLLGSTYMGGSGSDGHNIDVASTHYFYADDFRGEVNVDETGNIFVATCSRSQDFPTSSRALYRLNQGIQDGVVFSLNSTLSAVRWSTYLGGLADDALYSVDVMSDGNLLVAGGTRSNLLPTGAGGLVTDLVGNVDGYVAIINANGSNIEHATYVGTDRYDQVFFTEIDQQDNIYVVGHSSGAMPVKGTVYSNANSRQFVSVYNSNLTQLEMSTVFGSGKPTPDITINAFLVDDCGKVYVSGWGANIRGSGERLSNMPITGNAFQKTTDGNDFYIIVFEEELANLDFATYFGGNQTDDHVDGGTSRFDKRGVVYQSVCSSCPNDRYTSRISDFPTSSGAYSETNPSPRCSNASFKLAAVEYNYPPDALDLDFFTKVADTVTVLAFDSFEFEYTVRDPEGDSVFVTFKLPDELKEDAIFFQETYTGLGSITAFFKFFFTCKNARDTFRIKVYVRDNGCPNISSDSSVLTIVVEGPPPLPPPDVFCLYFNQDESLTLEWEPTDDSDEFYRMFLYRESPSGTLIVLDTLYTQGRGSYIDRDVYMPRERGYTYFLRVQNICGIYGDSSYIQNTVKESEVKVKPTEIRMVTVNNEQIEVHYLPSDEPDFDHYEIYRGERSHTESLVYYKSVYARNDTLFVDSNVDVNSISYCYEVRVADDCGHVSAFTDKNCTIVIDGVPINDIARTTRFSMDLNWDYYIGWPNGIETYTLMRAVDTGILRPIIALNDPALSYNDGNLDYDWGGYWYSVQAKQRSGGLDGTSRSNDIYLIQPPLVFVPNAVTANGDNLNDVFGWSDVFVREFEMRLYNRWGEKVFESSNKNETWDANFNKLDLPYSNVYFWIVTFKGWDNEFHTKKGTVTFMR